LPSIAGMFCRKGQFFVGFVGELGEISGVAFRAAVGQQGAIKGASSLGLAGRCWGRSRSALPPSPAGRRCPPTRRLPAGVPVGFGDVDPARGQCSVCSPMEPRVRVRELVLKTYLVLLSPPSCLRVKVPPPNHLARPRLAGAIENLGTAVLLNCFAQTFAAPRPWSRAAPRRAHRGGQIVRNAWDLGNLLMMTKKPQWATGRTFRSSGTSPTTNSGANSIASGW
jgi:hypothetical protein